MQDPIMTKKECIELLNQYMADTYCKGDFELADAIKGVIACLPKFPVTAVIFLEMCEAEEKYIEYVRCTFKVDRKFV